VFSGSKYEANDAWLPVLNPSTGTVAYVEKARVRPTPLKASTFKVDFDKVDAQGVATVSPETVKAAVERAEKFGKGTVSRVEVVGFSVNHSEEIGGTTADLMSRQASVVRALKEAGIEDAKIVPTVREAPSFGLNRTVELKVFTER